MSILFIDFFFLTTIHCKSELCFFVTEKKDKKKRKKNSNESDSEKGISFIKEISVKKEKHDPGYDKYDSSSNKFRDGTKHIVENLQSKSSYIREKHWTSESSSYHDESIHRDESKFKRKIRQERDSSHHKEFRPDNFQHASSSKSHKRQRSRSSSNDHSKKQARDAKFNDERDHLRSRHSDDTKYKNAKYSSASSSSSDSESSSQSSSSDSEKTELKNSHSKKSLRKKCKDKIHHEKDRSSDHHKSKDLSRSSSNNRYDEKPEKYSKHKSKSKYRNDDSDDAQKNFSYHKSRHGR